MRRWWAREGRNPVSRAGVESASPVPHAGGQAEPLAALAAVAVVGVTLALYAGAFEGAVPGETDRSVAEPTADRVERAVTNGGVIDPGRSRPLSGALDVGPEGREVNVTLSTGSRRYAIGPARPTTADVATRRVSVRTAPGRVGPGRLEVAVWT